MKAGVKVIGGIESHVRAKYGLELDEEWSPKCQVVDDQSSDLQK